MGFVYAISPMTAHQIAAGMKEWLASIPKPLYDIFGVGYLGYSASRSYDKGQIIKGAK